VTGADQRPTPNEKKTGARYETIKRRGVDTKGEEKEILLRGKVCAYLTCRLMGDPLLTPYPATPKFSLLRTCNTWVAEALESAGVPVSPRMVNTAGNLASQLAQLVLRPR
jgi:hypothetical protein